MTFAAYEVGTETASPIRLAEFVWTGNLYRYAACDFDVTSGGNNWGGLAFEHTATSAVGEVAKCDMTITLPKSNVVSQLYVGGVPDFEVAVNLYRTHRDDPDHQVQLVWSGHVVSSSPKGPAMRLTCEPLISWLRRPGLRRVTQARCPLAQYGTDGCFLDKADWAVPLDVTHGQRGATLTIPGSDALGYSLVGGQLDYDGVSRVITEHIGEDVTIIRPIAALDVALAGEVDVEVNTYRGCHGLNGTCRDVFHNIGNFWGFPGITGVNPFDGLGTLLKGR